LARVIPSGSVPVLALLLGLLLGSGPAFPARAAEHELLILEVRLGGHVLSAAMPGLLRGDRTLLPLGELCRALEFPIRADPAAGRGEGWFLTPGRTFSLELGTGEVRVAGEPAAWDEDAVATEADDLYVDARLLAQWFPVNLTVDLPTLQLLVYSREPLPVEQRLERERRRDRALAFRGASPEPSYPRVEAPYGWAGWPSLDVSLGGAHRRDPEGDSWDGSYSAFAAADLLKLSGDVFVSGRDGEALSELLLRLGKTVPDGGLLGPLDATEFGVGDVFSPSSALLTRGRRGRGLTVGNFPLERPGEFDRTTLRGEAPPGWEAELYRNGALLDFQVVQGDGRYEFEDVPMLYGDNLFVVALYGPHGQRKEETRRAYVGPGLIRPGQGHYRLAVGQHEEDLIPVGEDRDDRDARQGKPRAYAEYERGLGESLSAALSLASVPLEQDGEAEQHHYLGLGLRASALGLFSTLDLAADVGGGRAAQASVQARWGRVGLFGEHARFWDFESERALDGDPLVHRTRARADGAGVLALPFSLALGAEHDERESGRSNTRASSRLSVSARRLLVTNEAGWVVQDGGGLDRDEQVTGQCLLSGRAGNVSLRGAVGYEAHPVARLTTVRFTADWSSIAWGRFSGEVLRDLDGMETTTVALGWDRDLGLCRFGLRGGYGDDGTFTARASVDFSLGAEPRGGWKVSSQPVARKGSALARVLLDANGNGEVDPEDVPLEGVTFRVNRADRRELATGADGDALLTGLPAHRVSEVSIEPSSLADPFWVAQPPGRGVLVRPGGAPVLEFLVRETGEVEGTVYVRRGGEVRPAPGVRVQLLGSDRQVVQEVESAYDGFYLFERIPLGTLEVRLRPGEVERLDLEPPGARPVAITSGQPVARGADFVLESALLLARQKPGEAGEGAFP